MNKKLIILGLVVALGACSSPSKETGESTDVESVVDTVEVVMDSTMADVDSVMTEVDSTMTEMDTTTVE